MAIPLPIFLGTVNYTDYLHVTAAKVSSPSTVVWEDWINVPVTNYTLVIPALDPDNYYISFYDAPTNVALGTLVSQCFVNARSPEFAYEIRFYEIGNLPVTATLDVTQKILTDTYLENKTIESYFKEGFRFLEPDIDITFDSVTGAIELINGANFEDEEKFVVTIKYAVGTISSGGGSGLYNGTLNVTAATYTMLVADKNKRVRLVGSAATQVVTLPALSGISVDDGYYFDNTATGVANQVKFLTSGTDRVQYNGFQLALNEFDEFWVSKGQHLLLRKLDDDYWEVITDWKGTCVGEIVTVGYKDHPLIKTENGQLMDGDEWPLFWWWLNNVLPGTHKYVTDTVTGSFTADATKPGQFALHSTLKKWRMPTTVGRVHKGLANFETYGTDSANRPVDYPGGYQEEMLMTHRHDLPNVWNESGTGHLASGGGSNEGAISDKTSYTGGSENRVKNIGVLYARRMG
jgi:hypothetical protein